MTNPIIAGLIARAAGVEDEEQEEQEQESPFQITPPGKLPQEGEPKAQASPFQITPKEPSLRRKERPTIRERGGKAETVIESALDRDFVTPPRETEFERQRRLGLEIDAALRDARDPTFFARREAEIEFFRNIGQAQGTFAGDVTGQGPAFGGLQRPSEGTVIEMIGERAPGALPLLLGGPSFLLGVITGDPEARALLDPDIPLPPTSPPQNLEEVIDNNVVNIPPGLPSGVPIDPTSLVPRPGVLEQPPIFSASSGVIGAMVQSSRDMSTRLFFDPFGTVLGFTSAPFVLSYLGFKEALQNTVIAGPDASPQRMRIDELRNRFIDSIGRMTPYESAEARRGFMALLATGAYGYAVRAGLGPGTALRNLRSRRIIRRRTGMSAGEALKFFDDAASIGEGVTLATEEMIAAGQAGARTAGLGLPRFESIQQVLNFAEATGTSGRTLFRVQQVERFANMAGGLATFGTFIAEPGDKLARAITFTLGAIPLYATYAFLGAIGPTAGIRQRPGNNVRSPGRASELNRLRAARPFDKSTGPIPEVRTDTGDIPMGPKVADFEVVPTMDTPTHPDYTPRPTVVETARSQQQRIEAQGIPDPPNVPSSISERRAISDETRRRLFDIEERRRQGEVSLEDIADNIGERVDFFLSAFRNRLGITRELTERITSHDFADAAAAAADVSTDAVRQVVTDAVGDAEFRGDVTREEVINSLVADILSVKRTTQADATFEAGRRQGERRNIIRNAEKREISKVKDDLIEILAQRGVAIRGDFFRIIGSENFISGYLAHRGSPARQIQILRDVLREHFPPSQLTDAEIMTIASDTAVELNTIIQNRQVSDLGTMLDEIQRGSLDPSPPDVLEGEREGVDRRQAAGRREGEGIRNRRRNIIPLEQRPEGIGLENDMALLAIRQARGDVMLASQNLQILLEVTKSTGDAGAVQIVEDAIKVFHANVPQGIQQLNVFMGFPTVTRRLPTSTESQALEVAAFEATRLEPRDLRALAVGKEVAQVQRASEIIGDEAIATEWITMIDVAMNGSILEGIGAVRRLAEITNDLTPDQLQRLDTFRQDEFGIDKLSANQMRDLADIKAHWNPTRLSELSNAELIALLRPEIEAPEVLGSEGVGSMIKQVGIFQTLNGRGLSSPEIGVMLKSEFITEFNMQPEDADVLVNDALERINRASIRLDNVPRRVDFPGDPLVPSDVAEDLANWLKNEGDPIGALLDQVRNKPGQMVIVRGEENPGNTLSQAVGKLARDFNVFVHERADGLVDIAVAGPGSLLNLEVEIEGELRKPFADQFRREGRFRGQKVSIQGTNVEYVRVPIDPKTGKPDPNNIIIRSDNYIHPKNPRGEITVARSIARDIRDVVSINEFDRVGAAQRGLPERAMLRIKDAQISQVYQWMAEHIGDLTRMMSEGITFNKGNFNDMLLSVDKLVREMEPIDALTLRVMREIAENSLVKSNPIVPANVLQQVRAGVTADPESLTPAERRDFDRLKILGEDYAGFHIEIPTINRVQRLAQNAAIALGEFKFEEALDFLKALQGELGKGRANWEKVTADSTTPSIREILEEQLDPEELKVWDELVKKLQPPDARKLLESGEEFSFDRLREAANTNGMKLEINTSGTYVLRGKDRGYELFASPNIKDIAKFMRDSGQAEGLDIDAAHDVDPKIPGSVQPPPADPPRVNEPMPFPEGRLIEMMLEGATAITPFLSPFKDWAAGYDAINGTRIHENVWLRTQGKAFESAATAARWSNFVKKTSETDPGLKDAEAAIKKSGLKSRQQRELVERYLNSMSKEEVLDLLNTEEKAIVSLMDTLLDQGANAQTSFKYIDDLRTELKKTASRLGFGEDITKLGELLQKNVAARVQSEKNYTPVDVGIARFFTEIAKRPHSEMNLPLIIRAFEAGRTGALNRADFARANDLTPEQVTAIKELDAYMERIAAKEGVRIKDLAKLRAYQGNYAWRQTAAPEDAYLGQKGIDEELKFVNSMVRMGETAAYTLDPIEVAARFTKGAANQATGFDKAWEEAQKFIRTLPKGSLGRMVSESYIGAVRGNLPAITKEVENIVNTIFKQMGWKVPTTTIRSMVNGMLALMSTAAISLRPGLTVRDLTTGVGMHYARFGGSPIKGQGRIRKGFESVGIGPSRTIRMLQLGFGNIFGVRRELVDQGIVPSVGPIRFETPSELLSSNLGQGINRLPKFVQDVANWGFVWGGQKTMYEVMFTGTLLESREFVGNAATMFQKGEINKAEFYNIIKLDAFQRVIQKEFDDLITAEKWEQATELLSRQAGIDILGLYGAGQHPWGWGTNTGKMFGQFGIWPVNAAQFVLGGLTRGRKNSIPVLNHFVSGRQIGFATRLAMTQAALFVGGQAMGMDFYRWLLFPGIFFTGGPTVQMAQDVADIINGSDDDRRRAVSSLKSMLPEIDTDDMRNTDLRSMFFPFGYFIGDIQLGIRAFENGEPLPGVLGRFFAVPLSDKPSWLDTGEFFREE